MKPSKQKISDPKLKKKNVKVKGVAPNKIESYFQPTAKNQDENIDGDATQSIYVEALKKKLQDAVGYPLTAKNPDEVGESKMVGCEMSATEDHTGELFGAHCVLVENIPKIDQTKKPVPTPNSDYAECKRPDCVQKAIDCQEWERKYKEMKKTYLSLTISYSEEHMKYKNLLKATSGITSSDTDKVLLSDDGIFTLNEMKALQRISVDKPKDSTFIMECLQYAYKNNPADLCQRTLKGTSEKVEFNEKGEEVKRQPGKNPLTPEKITRIKELFINRISNSGVNAAEHSERINDTYMNRLFASGIKNISKKYPDQ